MALSLFQEMHGHGWLKENPHACAVLGWQGATSASLLADASAASLLCATHHAVTDGLQQKPLQSHPALHHGAGGGSIHPIPISFCISPTSEGRKKRRMALGRSRPSWNTLEVTADPKPSQLQEFTPDQPLPPLNPQKEGSAAATAQQQPPKCLCHERSWKECARPHDRRGHRAVQRIESPQL